MDPVFVVVVIRACVGNESGYRVVAMPRDCPDTTLAGEYATDLPEGWKDFGFHRKPERALEVARFVVNVLSSPIVAGS